MKNTKNSGFTIVELLIVIVVIAILAAVTIVGYAGISSRATVSALHADLHNGATTLGTVHAVDGVYPSSLPSGVTPSGEEPFAYSRATDGSTYCLSVTSGQVSYNITQDGVITEGDCSIADGAFIQDITAENCPNERTRAVDARDNHTYWVQNFEGRRCWMLTNLAYAGGGNDAYGDTISTSVLSQGTSGTSYTEARYYIVPSTTNYTTEPTAPSTSTDGTGQYGYLYNWCAAMGVQIGTSACANATTPLPDQDISICPAGWRLPRVPSSAGEFTDLYAPEVRSEWLEQRSGWWTGGGSFSDQGTNGQYYSATQSSGSQVRRLQVGSSGVNGLSGGYKNWGHAVRCVAN